MHLCRLPVVLLVLFCLLIATTTVRADWPSWRNGGRGEWRPDFEIAEAIPEGGLHTVWEAKIGGGYAGVTVAKGRVYTMDRRIDKANDANFERVLCFDLKTGKPLWTFEYACDYGDLTYDSGPRASVTIHDGMAYTLGAVGHAYCLNAETGEVNWSVDTMKELGSERPTWGFAASPVIIRDTVLYHVGAKPTGTIVAFDRKTGEIKWRSGTDPAGYATPLVWPSRKGQNSEDRLMVWTPEHLICMLPSDGTVFWKFPYKIQYGVSIATPIFSDAADTVLVSGAWHGVRAIRVADNNSRVHELAWKNEASLRAVMAQPVTDPSAYHAYLLDKQRGLTCFDIKTGEIKWRDDKHQLTPRGAHPQMTTVTLLDGDCLALNSNGELINLVLKPEGFTERWRAKVIDSTWAHPAYVDKYVIARSDSRIACVELPVAE